ncbi:MAG: molybdate ABC transporter substrate-binding protein [Stappiaceae bacterium]
MGKWLVLMLFAASGMFGFMCSASAATVQPLTVFAASSLKNVLEEILPLYETQTGQKVIVSLAASSTLARQIEAGAPADVYISADRAWMDYLVDKGRIVENSQQIVAMNSLVAVGAVNDSAPLDVADTNAVLERLGDGRLAVADPDHVPAGRYAKSALETLRLWPVVMDRLVPADNVRVALTLVARGEVPLGIVYASDAYIDDRVTVLARLPTGSHPPIVYPAATIKGANEPDAARFIDFLTFHEPQVAFINAGFRPIE